MIELSLVKIPSLVVKDESFKGSGWKISKEEIKKLEESTKTLDRLKKKYVSSGVKKKKSQ